ncbi:MAG: GDP-mannose 4,6-dehydratase [Bdellovibrionota bacterium]
MQPNSPYSASKASSDHLVRAWNKTYNFPSIITHCSNNYGPFQHSEKLIPLVIKNCIEEKSLPIYGTGKNVRDWIYVDDHVEGLIAVAKNGTIGNVYNMGGNTELSNLELVKKICTIMDQLKPRSNKRKYSQLMEFVQDRLGHDFRYSINNHYISSSLGWSPKTSLDNGLEKTITFFLEKFAK